VSRSQLLTELRYLADVNNGTWAEFDALWIPANALVVEKYSDDNEVRTLWRKVVMRQQA
jgi:hypothetical protein